jgi:hypothetical protein
MEWQKDCDPTNEAALYVVTDEVNTEVATWLGKGCGGGWTKELRDVDRDNITRWLELPPLW